MNLIFNKRFMKPNYESFIELSDNFLTFKSVYEDTRSFYLKIRDKIDPLNEENLTDLIEEF